LLCNSNFETNAKDIGAQTALTPTYSCWWFSWEATLPGKRRGCYCAGLAGGRADVQLARP
jgi:hypothetical protein